MRKVITVSLLLLSFSFKAQVNHDQIGAWYVYNFIGSFGNSGFGVQGDVQYRAWNQLSDLEQLLLRAGLSYQLKNTGFKFTAGAVHVTSGVFGSDKSTSEEVRFYQEILHVKWIKRLNLTNRIRCEQRMVEGQNFRTRYRYAINLIVPVNKERLEKNAVYTLASNEIFINGEKNIGHGKSVKTFDRNRLLAAIGYQFSAHMRFQIGLLCQTTTFNKFQIHYTLNHTF